MNRIDYRKKGETSKSELKSYHNVGIGDELEGLKVKKIYTSHDQFITYKTKGSIDVKFIINDEIDDREANISEDYTKLSMSLTRREKIKHGPILASILSICFEGNPVGAKSICTSLAEKINKDRQFEARLFYMLSILIVLAFNFLMSLILMYKKLPSNQFNINISQLYFLATLGSLGGFISIAIKLKSMKLDPEASFRYHFAVSTLRLIVSMVGAIVIHVLVRSDILFGFLKDSDHIFGQYFLAVLSGFSERLLPNVFYKTEGQLMASINAENIDHQQEGRMTLGGL